MRRAFLWFVLTYAIVGHANPTPAILFASPHGANWGFVDLQYLSELHDRGFEVDYTDKLGELDWTRLKQYNVLVLYHLPGKPGPAKNDPEKSKLVELCSRFLSEGGGLFLFPTTHSIDYQALYDIAHPWGARLPVERIKEDDPNKQSQLSHGAYRVPLAYTDVIPASPVSEGVTGIWYPTSHSYNAQHTGPIDVDNNWTVVLRASATAKTHPVDLAKSNSPKLHDPFSRAEGVSSPALFAIRQCGKGRMALFNQWRQYSVGSGTKWLYNREVLSAGVNGQPSDLQRLLDNTFRWLAKPSRHLDTIGGYKTGAETLKMPNAREKVRAQYHQRVHNWQYETARWHKPRKSQPLFRGLIGAKTRFSSGKDDVAAYAKAARAAKLDFLVFLEDFQSLSQDNLAKLTADCHSHSSEDLLLLPGFTIKTNIGDHLFMFGPEPSYPDAEALGGENGKTLMIQPVDTNGRFTGFNGPAFSWILSGMSNNQFGYFHFADVAGSQDLEDLRLFSMAGMYYYRDGQAVERVPPDAFLRTSQGTLGPLPVSINEVKSAAALTAELASGNALTYAQAPSLKTLYKRALRWAHQYDGNNVFASSGPLIHDWPGCHRTYTLGAENFVTLHALMPSRIHVTSDVGLKEIRLYDGQRLFQRYLLNGAKKLDRTLLLSGVIHRNIVLVAEDVNGGQAISSPRRAWKCGGRQVVFCGDHVNDCKSGGMLLGRGPNTMIVTWTEPLPDDVGGYSWDGGPPASSPLADFGDSRPIVKSSAGNISGNWFTQTPLLDVSDEGVVGVSSLQERMFEKSLLRVVNPWHTFGPIAGPSEALGFKLSYREYHTPTVGVPGASWAAVGVREGISSCLFRSTITFKKEQTVETLTLLRNFSKPANSNIHLAWGRSTGSIEQAVALRPDLKPINTRLEPGDWFALFSPGTTNSHLFVNRKTSVILHAHSPSSGGNWLRIAADVKGQTFQANDTHDWELFSLGLPVNQPVSTPETLLALWQALTRPDGLHFEAGERTAGAGLIECLPHDHIVSVSMPRPLSKTSLTIPLRIQKLNPRWSAGLWQRAGYVKGDYGNGENRYRPLGVDDEGFAYVPLYADWADMTDIVAGHPVVADGGESLFIQVTHAFAEPHKWHVAVNNPTDQEITATIRAAMTLPGLALVPTDITLAPGEYRVLNGQQ